MKVLGNKEGWVEGSNFVLEVDAVIPSIGTSANPLLAQTTPDMQFNRKGSIVVE